MRYLLLLSFVFCLILVNGSKADASPYTLLPGDQINVSVWNEDALNLDLIVLPDGSITFPLAGRIIVEGLTTEEVSNQIKEKLQAKEIIFEPEVSVTITSVSGNQVYVIGKVTSPGAYVLTRNLTIPQLLSLAGGLDRFANENEIKVLSGSGNQAHYSKFDFNELLDGENPEKMTIPLKAGDVVIVP